MRKKIKQGPLMEESSKKDALVELGKMKLDANAAKQTPTKLADSFQPFFLKALCSDDVKSVLLVGTGEQRD